MIKNYGYSILIVFGSILLINLITTILNYFNLVSSNTISIINFVMMIISIFVSSYILGTKSKEKGYLEGLKFGGIVVLLFILLVLLFDRFVVKSLIYYSILILTSILGSMVGINRKSS